MYIFFLKKNLTFNKVEDYLMSSPIEIYRNPKVWNESVWMFLYCIGSTCPTNPTKKDVKMYNLFIHYFYTVLPCSICKSYFEKFLEKNSIATAVQKNRLLPFMIRLRNYVMKHYGETEKVTIRDIENDLSTKCFQQTKPMTIKNPKIWGNHAWLFLHCSSFNYPKFPTETEKKNYHEFLKTLHRVLPCKLCRRHLQEYMEVTPIEPFLQKRESYIKYIIALHNHVNEKFNKKQRITLKQAKESIYQNCLEQYQKK